MVTDTLLGWLFGINVVGIVFALYGLGVAKRWWK